MSSSVQKKATDGSGEQAAQRTQRSEPVLTPLVDIYETADGITVLADMPGVQREHLNVRVDVNSLLIEGSIGLAPQQNMSAVSADVRSTLYRRNFSLSSELEPDKIDANLKDGVLTVTIPKRAEVRPRRIEVRS